MYQSLYGENKFQDNDNDIIHNVGLSTKSEGHMHMTVGMAGSGKVLSYGYMLCVEKPLANLPYLLNSLLPPNLYYYPQRHHVFLAHGGKQLKSTKRGQTMR